MTYLALLRGINVGGKSMVNMANLKSCFEALGYKSVVTYINSGNVIFVTSKTDPRKLEKTIEKTIKDHFKFPVKVLVRSQPEYEKVIQNIPKSWAAAELKCNVIFLHHSIDTPDILSDLNLKKGIEEAHYYPGLLFWAANTSDLTKSSMIKLSSRPIYKSMTIRNLNTTKKLHELMKERIA